MKKPLLPPAQSRAQRRLTARLVEELNTQVAGLVLRFAKFCEGELNEELQVKRIKELNEEYLAWLLRHPKSYDFRECSDLFYRRLCDTGNAILEGQAKENSKTLTT